LAKNPEGKFGVRGGKAQPANEAADFIFSGGGRAPLLEAAGIRFQITTGTETLEQECGDALEVGGGGGDMFFRLRSAVRTAHEFVEADGYGLAKIHGAMFSASGDTHEPVAVAEIFIRKATLLRTEEKGDTAAGELLVQETCSLVEAADRMLHLALPNGGGSDNESAILNGFSDSFEFFGATEYWSGANSRTRLAKSQFIGVHHAKMKEAEVAHGAGGSADVEGIARGDKHDTQEIGFGVG
jgi:hypothetical protein